MVKYLKIITIILTIFIICGCSNQNVYQINYKEFNNLINNQENFILYIGSGTCINCTEFKPKFESIIKKNKISDAYYIDLDEFSDEEKKSFYKVINITGTPTVIFITDGEEKSSFNRINGNVTEEKIITRLKANGYIK